jgi:uncharacterized protein involved in exopolysaccharide biosynthesis
MEEQAIFGAIRDLLLVLVRRRALVLWTWAIMVAGAVGAIFLLPPRYRATAKVLLTSDRAAVSDVSNKSIELSRSSQVSDSEINSQLVVLLSRELVEDVLRGMNVKPEEGDEVARPASPGWIRMAYRHLHHLENVEPVSPLFDLSTSVLENLSADRIGQSNVIEIAYTGGNPVWAEDFVNHLTNAYIERHGRLQQITEAEDFFTKQSDILQRKLADSESALKQLREKAGSLAGQQAEIHQRANEFAADLARTRIARAEEEERVAFLERAQSGATGGHMATPELLQLEAKRAELIGRYRPESERVRDIDDQIRRLRSAMTSYDSVATAGGSGATDLTAAKASLAALRGKEDAIAKQSDEYRQQAEMLDSQNFDLARLERQVKLDEEAYLSYVRTAEESRLSNALEQSKLMHLIVVEPATTPLEPVSPKRRQLLVIGLLGGLAAGVAIAIARDRFDTTLRTAADVRRYGNVEVLAVLPERAA